MNNNDLYLQYLDSLFKKLQEANTKAAASTMKENIDTSLKTAYLLGHISGREKYMKYEEMKDIYIERCKEIEEIEDRHKEQEETEKEQHEIRKQKWRSRSR